MVGPGPKVKFTYQDYRNAPEDRRYELLDGDMVMVPSPRTDHQRVSRDLGFVLWTFVKERDLGQVFSAPFDVVLSDTDVVQPDLLFVSNERASIVTDENVQGAPDLVIEILSSGTADRDRTFKRSLYARHGVREYWLVDPDARRVEVLVLSEGRLEPEAAYEGGDVMSSPLLDALRLNLSEVL